VPVLATAQFASRMPFVPWWFLKTLCGASWGTDRYSCPTDRQVQLSDRLTGTAVRQTDRYSCPTDRQVQPSNRLAGTAAQQTDRYSRPTDWEVQPPNRLAGTAVQQTGRYSRLTDWQVQPSNRLTGTAVQQTGRYNCPTNFRNIYFNTLYRASYIILYNDQQTHNYFTNFHTPTSFDIIVPSGSL
jgi:hypothetical protein